MASPHEDKLKRHRWFLMPRDAATNEHAFDELLRLTQSTKEYICVGREDVEGEQFDVLEVTRSFILNMEKDPPRFYRAYVVFVQEQGRPKMRRWVIHNRQAQQTIPAVVLSGTLANYHR